MLFYQTISPGLNEILHKLMSEKEINHFYLAGGTSLALQFGHRKSVDIDLFSDSAFNRNNLLNTTRILFPQSSLLYQNQTGVGFVINDIKVEFLEWKVPLIKPLLNEKMLRLASPEDIAAMKMDAIVGRKEKKDFYDVSMLLQHYTLSEFLQFYKKKYPFQELKPVIENLQLASKADKQPDPEILDSSNWETVKLNITSAVQSFIQERVAKKKSESKDRLDNLESKIEAYRKNKGKGKS